MALSCVRAYGVFLLTMEDSQIITVPQVDGPSLHTPEQLWSMTKEALATRLSPGNYNTWIEPLKLHEAKGGHLVLSGPNHFFLNWVKSHFASDLTESLVGTGFVGEVSWEFITTPEPASASAVCSPSGSNYNNSSGASASASKAKPSGGHLFQERLCEMRPLQADDRFSFDNFVVGDSNLYAFSAAKAMAAGDSLGADALFLTSDHGLGKSHLSLALSKTLLHNQPRSQIYYLTAEDFTNEMTHALRHGGMEAFKSKYRRNCDVLVLEEIQFMSGKEKIQSELCFTLDYLVEQSKKIIFTSPHEPKDIPRIGRSLRSRLSSALVSPIGAPEYDTRLNILLKKSRGMGLKVARSVLEYVAERVTSDVRRLESCLISLKAKSQLLGRQIDLDMARESMNYIFEEQQGGSLTPLGIRALICRHFHLEVSEITSKSRSRRTNEARTLGMYLSRQHTGRTLGEIGQAFGRTHSSTLYSINKLEQSMKKDPRMVGKVEFFSQELLK